MVVVHISFFIYAVLLALLGLCQSPVALAEGESSSGNAPEVTWKQVKACDAGSSCLHSFNFVTSRNILDPILANVEVLDKNKAVVDIAAYNSKDSSWTWYIPSTMPAGQYQFRFINSKGSYTLISPIFSVVGTFKLCTTEAFKPRTMENPEALRVMKPLATTYYDPEDKINLNIYWVNMPYRFGADVMSLSIDLIPAQTREKLGEVVQTYEMDPKKEDELLIPKTITPGQHILRFRYKLAEDPEKEQAAFSEVFPIGKKPVCANNSTIADGAPSSGSKGSNGSPSSSGGSKSPGQTTGSDAGGGAAVNDQAAEEDSSGLSTAVVAVIAVAAGLVGIGLIVLGLVMYRRRRSGGRGAGDADLESHIDNNHTGKGGETSDLPFFAVNDIGAAPASAGVPGASNSQWGTGGSGGAGMGSGGVAAAGAAAVLASTPSRMQQQPAITVGPTAAAAGTVMAATANDIEESGSAPANLCTKCGRVGSENGEAQFCTFCGSRLLSVVVTASSHVANAVAVDEVNQSSLSSSTQAHSGIIRQQAQGQAAAANMTSSDDNLTARKQAFISEHVEGGQQRPSSAPAPAVAPEREISL